MEKVIEVAEIATAAKVCSRSDADQILRTIAAGRPFVAGSLATYDPVDRSHRTLSSFGYSDQVLSHLTGRFLVDDVAYQYYSAQGRNQKALRWSEMPFLYEHTYSARSVFMPSGFREGITLLLFSSDGRYTGSLHLSTDDHRYPTRDMIDNEVQRLRTILGNFADVLRCVPTNLDDHHNATGCVLTRSELPIALPGVKPVCPSLLQSLSSQMRDVSAEQIPSVFLFRHNAAWFHIHTGLLQNGGRTLIANEFEVPYDLTPREIEIINLLVSGQTNAEIASRLFVTRATVAKHLENIFDKMNCSTRTAVVTAALALNLRRLPRPTHVC